ncbi:MAG: hypothetical protein II592_03865 [Muribaculaceae bacterium]|nr:hypothetical protein [Muribaculaceae bacterium]MBQ4138661.1 hypothetical protein [Muribaculaceae bacterium]
MKIFRSKRIPFKGFAAINLFGFIVVRRGIFASETLINHERIHTAQMRELGFIFFYLLYGLEWLIRLPMKGNAYRNITFEQEAYDHQNEPSYLEVRKHYAPYRYYLCKRKRKRTNKKKRNDKRLYYER